MKNLLVKHNNSLVPYTDEDSKAIYNLKEGELIAFSIDKARNVQYHRKYFALLNKVLHHLPEELSEKYNTTEKLLLEIKLQLGYYDVHVTLGEREVVVVKQSISFKQMTQKRFERFVNDSKQIILKYFLKDIDEKTFDNEFMTLFF